MHAKFELRVAFICGVNFACSVHLKDWVPGEEWRGVSNFCLIILELCFVATWSGKCLVISRNNYLFVAAALVGINFCDVSEEIVAHLALSLAWKVKNSESAEFTLFRSKLYEIDYQDSMPYLNYYLEYFSC